MNWRRDMFFTSVRAILPEPFGEVESEEACVNTMKSNRTFCLCVTILLAASIQAPADEDNCVIERSGPYSPNVKQMLAAWLDLAKTATQEQPNLQEAVTLAGSIIRLDARARHVFVDVLSQPEPAPMAKVVAKFSLESVGLDPVAIERLQTLTQPGLDITTRLCAIELLSSVQGEDIEHKLTGWMHDDHRQVRFVATQALAGRNPAYRKNLQAFWDESETTGHEKVGIVLTLAKGPAFDSLPIFCRVINDDVFGEPVRAVAIEALSQVGDGSCVTALVQCKEKAPTEALRQAAGAAVDAIQARAATTRTAVTEE